MRLRLLASSAVLFLLVAGCKAATDPKAFGTPGCPAVALADGAVVSYAGGGGITGATQSFVAFPDGRVELSADGKPRTVTVSRDRLDELQSDLRATGVLDEDQGCYIPDEAVADGTGAELELRDGASVRKWTWSDGARAPDAVDKALGVARAFLDDASRQP